MRVLLHGMQSSGASLLTLLIGQIPRSMVVVDLFNRERMPDLRPEGVETVVAKCVVTTRHTFEDHARAFQPDRSILVLRHPFQNYISLSRKYYANESGAIDDKFRELERVFLARGDLFDLAVIYEDFIQRRRATVAALQRIDLNVKSGFYRFRRSPDEIREFNFAHSPWCRRYFGERWNFGNVRGTEIRRQLAFKYVPRSVEDHVRALCPAVCDHFDRYYSEHVSWVARQGTALWHDVIVRGGRAVRSRVRRYASRVVPGV